jgi:hypothetical protein
MNRQKTTPEYTGTARSNRPSRGKKYLLHHVVLPYQLTRSSRGYSLYERLDD